MKRFAWSAFVLLALCGTALPGSAHKPSDSYLTLDRQGDTLTGQWHLALSDLEFLVGLDVDQDGRITWGELKSRRDAVIGHALSRLKLELDGQAHPLEVTALRVTDHSDGVYAVLDLATDLPADTPELTLTYSLLFDEDPTHRGLILDRHGSQTDTYVLSPDAPSVTLRDESPGLWPAFLAYTREGVWHIWIGFDHILFLMCLLLPAVFVAHGRGWQPVTNFAPALWAVLKIVTCFTIAHSITLWLAVMEWVTVPARLIESTIAFSILVTASHNLFPRITVRGWAIAFGFGLIHGFGFANVLVDLGLREQSLAAALFGFNVGVELGQTAIVLGFFPVAFALRHTFFYRRILFIGGSALMALTAALWMLERVLAIKIIGF